MGDLKLNGSTSGTITVTPTAIAGTNTITLPASTGTVALTASPTFTGTTTVASLSATGTISSVGAASLGLNGALSGYVTAQGSANTTNTGFFGFYTSAGMRQAYIGYIGTPNDALNIETDSGSNKPIRFATNSTEAARIDTSGNLLVGTTTIVGTHRCTIRNTSDYQLCLDTVNSGTSYATISYAIAGTSKAQTYYDNAQGRFIVIANASGGVYLANGATSWTSVSDERAKDIIEPITDATTKVSTLRAIIGSYKSDESKKRRSFLIAQDVQAVLPEAVDATNPDNLGLAYADVIPLLVAAIQELSAKNDALEARLAALEAK